MTIIQDRKHNQIIHFKEGYKRTLLNVIKVWQNTWTHCLLENGTEWIINPDNVLAIEIEWLEDKKDNDLGPCYRCHMWPCNCTEGPLMSKKRFLVGRCVNCHWEQWSDCFSDKILTNMNGVTRCNNCLWKYPKCDHYRGPDTSNSVNVCENCDGK